MIAVEIERFQFYLFPHKRLLCSVAEISSLKVMSKSQSSHHRFVNFRLANRILPFASVQIPSSKRKSCSFVNNEFIAESTDCQHVVAEWRHAEGILLERAQHEWVKSRLRADIPLPSSVSFISTASTKRWIKLSRTRHRTLKYSRRKCRRARRLCASLSM